MKSLGRTWRGWGLNLLHLDPSPFLFLTLFPFLFLSISHFSFPSLLLPYFFFSPRPHPTSSRSGVRVVNKWHAPAGSCSAPWVSHASRQPAGLAAPVPQGCRGPPAGAPEGLLRGLPTPPAQLCPVSTGAPAVLRRLLPSSAACVSRAGMARAVRPPPPRPRSRRSRVAREPPARPSEGISAATASATARAAAGMVETAR